MAIKKNNTAPLAAHAAKAVTDTMQNYSDWLTEQTGHKVDALSVQLGSALRATWQAEQRAAKEAAAVKPKPRTRKPAATIATAEGVVIAEQQHVEVA